jgi:hypothetical protein
MRGVVEYLGKAAEFDELARAATEPGTPATYFE